jgi:hypothetical protein
MILDFMMVNWSGQPIPHAEMMVMRRVAVEMRTFHQARIVEFSHDICAGIVRFDKDGVFNAVGGSFFFGDFGAKNGKENTVVFFLPRRAFRRDEPPDFALMQSGYTDSDQWRPEGRPHLIDRSTAVGEGDLMIRVRHEH